jgi:outer membrane protein, multidrug efflux system
MLILRISTCFCLLFLSSCRVGPEYTPPELLAPDSWKNPYAAAELPQFREYWWEVFDDELLNCLETHAVEYNPTLYVALQSVFEARATAGVVGADLYPQLFCNPSYSSVGILQQLFLPSGVQQQLPGLTALQPFRIHQLQYLLPMDLSYEVDLWGKIRDQYDSAVFNAEAQSDAYYNVMLTLTSDLASAYFQLRGYDAQIDLYKATIQTREKNLQLTQNRFNKGLVTYLDVTQAQVDLANASASYEDAIRLRKLAENQIAVLTGAFASDFCIEHRPLRDSPPVIPAGIPSTVLLRRPDIAQNERAMASQHALVNAAHANFFPSLTLTGALGYSSPDIRQFLKWISRYWAAGANASQMVFDGGRDDYNLEAAWARFFEATGTYQQTVLTAFQEVEDSLNNIEQYHKEARQLQIAVEASRKATGISLNRYQRGVAIYLEVVENERLQLQAETNYVNVQSLLYVSTVQLIKALGGGFGCLN